jgi:hypothetical protein
VGAAGSDFTLPFETLVMGLVARPELRVGALRPGPSERRAVFVIEGRDQETVERFVGFLEGHGGDRRRSARSARTCRRPISRWVLKHLRCAETTFDRYHSEQLGKAIEQIRREEGKQHKRLLQNTRYPWLKRPANLIAKQLDWLDQLLRQPVASVRAGVEVRHVLRARRWSPSERRLMYAAIRQYEMGAGSLPDLMRYVDDELGDTMAALPGFIGYYVIASGEDEIVSVTIFEAEPDAVRSSRAAADFVRDRLGPFQVNLTSAMSGEVAVWRSAPALSQHPE